jgi:hypothetical protein
VDFVPSVHSFLGGPSTPLPTIHPSINPSIKKASPSIKMNKLLATLLVVLAVVNSAAAFNIRQAAPALSTRSLPTASSSSSSRSSPFETIVVAAPSSTTTSLQLKIKIDPEKAKIKNAAGMAKGAAYGGSILIAVLLPVAFLIWAAIK